MLPASKANSLRTGGTDERDEHDLGRCTDPDRRANRSQSTTHEQQGPPELDPQTRVRGAQATEEGKVDLGSMGVAGEDERDPPVRKRTSHITVVVDTKDA